MPTDWILYMMIALLVVIQAASLYVIWRQHQRLSKQSSRLDELKREQHAIVSGNLGLGRKLFQFKNNLQHLEQSQVEIEQSGTNSGAFEQAAKMLRQGISIDDVVESCHISRGEAELLNQMLTTTSFH